jgi:hypothetical protein
VSESEATGFLKIKYPRLLLFFLAIALVPYVILSFFIHPIADDFDAALRGGDNYWPNQLRYYMEWNGRYSANLFVFVTSLFVKHIFLYRLFPVILIALLIASAFYLSKNCLSQLRILERLAISFVFVLLFLNILPDESEGLYWFTGSVTYVFPLALTLLYLSLLIRYFRKRIIANHFFHTLISSALLLFLCGFNEVLSFTLAVSHFIFALVSFKHNPEKKHFVLVLLLVALGGMIAMATAPGNAVRSLNFPERHLFLHSMLYSCLQSVRFTASWIASPCLLAFTFFYLPFARRFPISRSKMNPFISTSILFLIVFCAVFPAYWSMGILGQHRTINSGLFFFLIVWVVNLHIIAKRLPESFFGYYSKRLFRNSMAIIMLLTFFLTGSGLTSWQDFLTGKARQYDKELATRAMILSKCKQSNAVDCSIPALTVRPKSIFVLDIMNSPTHFINVDYAIYYGLNSVSLQK